MVIKEKLTWILDQNEAHAGEEEYRINIDFVHSLGKKCDCVGWSKLDMDEPDAYAVLDAVDAFCKKNNWSPRGWYTRYYEDISSDWYELKTASFKDGTHADTETVMTEDGRDIKLPIIRAYHELTSSPKDSGEVCVPERFRNACIKNDITDVDFYWLRDKGKYAAEQYFCIYPHKRIAHIVCDRGIRKDASRKQALGGHFPKIASVLSTVQGIDLQDCYLAEDMPGGGIAYVYCPATYDHCEHNKLLIHKDTAEMLIAEKALSRTDLTPACLLDACPKEYTLVATEAMPKPAKAYIEKSLTAYAALKSVDRPVRNISEKEALKVLRKAKRERKTDFKKRIGKAAAEALSEGAYSRLLPYYQVANGGYLSDEYEWLSYEVSVSNTADFLGELEKEELLETKPKGIVIATCADGDTVLMGEDGNVFRFSHESPQIISEWKTAAQFVVDAINENT